MEGQTNDGQDDSTFKQMSVEEERILTIIEEMNKQTRSTFNNVLNLMYSYKFPIAFTILQDVTNASVEIRLKLSKVQLDKEGSNRR